MDAPRRIPIHRALNRPSMLLGGDRELVLMSGLVAALLAFSSGAVWGVVAGIVFWVVAVAVLSRVGNADPLMRQVLIRHHRYQSHFPASARWCGRARGIALHWKGR